MRIAAAIALMAALTTGCSALGGGYRDVNDLKAEAKYRNSRDLERDPVLVYRDVMRALAGCTRSHLVGPYREVISLLNRETDHGEVSLTHQGRFIARWEISKIGEGKARVSGWWTPRALECVPFWL